MKKSYNTVESEIIHKSYFKSRLIVFIVLIFVLLSMTIGYAANLSTDLSIFGNTFISAYSGDIEIISITNTSSVNGTDNGNSFYNVSTDDKDTLTASFDIGFIRTGGSSTMSITYQVVIKNNSRYTKTLSMVNSTSTFSEGSSTLSYSLSGAHEGTTVISPGGSITVTIVFSLGSNDRNQQYTVNEIFEFIFSEDSSSETGSFSPVLETTSVTFDTFDSLVKLNIYLDNTTDSDISYNFSTSNSNFVFTDSNGNELGSQSISANSSEDKEIYLKISSDHLFTGTEDSLTVLLNTTGPSILTYSLGSISATVPSGGVEEIIGTDKVVDDTSIDFTSTSSSSGVFVNTTSDGETTYFYRGNVTNNYVSFAGYTWRIIRIDKYGTRIILDSILDSTVAWASSNTTTNASLDEAIELLKYENSAVKPIVDKWYDSNLSSYSDIIKSSLFCEDMSYQSMTSSGSNNTTYYFGSYLRNGKDSAGYTPEFVCDEEYIVTYNIGLISGDEVAFAGGLFNTGNKNYYLYNSSISSIWWTISPSYYDTSMKTVGTLIVNGSTGNFYDWQDSNTIANSYAIRPVITLDTDRLSGGTGTSSDPYTFS